MAATKEKVCAITRSDWDKVANVKLATEITDKIKSEIEVGIKQFGTGSFGVYGSGKVSVNVNGKIVNLQCAVSGIVVNSKEAK